MKIQQNQVFEADFDLSSMDKKSDWVLVLGSRFHLENVEITSKINRYFQCEHITFCSTAGEIHGDETFDDSISITSVKFGKSSVESYVINSAESADSLTAGQVMAETISLENLKHLFVVADGRNINATAFLKGLKSGIGEGVSISGGLAGDGPRFEKTLVGLNSTIGTDHIVAIGFYGDNLQISYDARGGWEAFGPERLVTKSENNVLLEIDEEPALQLYKKYLGEYAKKLPENALHFPICVNVNKDDNSEMVTRTVLAVDDNLDSLTFAGDIPQGVKARLMKSSSDVLIKAAKESTEVCVSDSNPVELALIVNCVGRKLVLGQKIEEELEGVVGVLGNTPKIAGFYSYGSIGASHNQFNTCLHNQTFAITTFSES